MFQSRTLNMPRRTVPAPHRDAPNKIYKISVWHTKSLQTVNNDALYVFLFCGFAMVLCQGTVGHYFTRKNPNFFTRKIVTPNTCKKFYTRKNQSFFYTKNLHVDLYLHEKIRHAKIEFFLHAESLKIGDFEFTRKKIYTKMRCKSISASEILRVKKLCVKKAISV